MKTYIFRKSDSLEFIHITAANPADAIRLLVAAHGKRAYALVAITQ
jgi:hypothetical protein